MTATSQPLVVLPGTCMQYSGAILLTPLQSRRLLFQRRHVWTIGGGNCPSCWRYSNVMWIPRSGGKVVGRMPLRPSGPCLCFAANAVTYRRERPGLTALSRCGGLSWPDAGSACLHDLPLTHHGGSVDLLKTLQCCTFLVACP